MTSLLYFQATQAVHGADDITILHFQTQVNYLSVCGPQVDTLFFVKQAGLPNLIQLTVGSDTKKQIVFGKMSLMDIFGYAGKFILP